MSDLLKINVSDHTEKKNGLTYLSWAWAWAEVLKIDPQATWEPINFAGQGEAFQMLCRMDDATALVGVDATIKGITRRCLLPVMDHKNKAIPKPNAFDVNKAQTGVQQILSDEANGYGAKNVKDVKCNNGQNPTVKKGDSFTCEVSIDGTKRQVTVTFQDDKGTYEVGRPK